MSLPLQSNIKVIKIKKKYRYLCLAFFILVCIPGFGLVYYAIVLYDINVSELIKASDLIFDKLYMDAYSGSERGDDVPDLSSDDTSSEGSDTDHEQDVQHRILQELLERRAEEHQRHFEEQARMEDLEGQNRQLDDQARQLEERARQVEERARQNEEIAQQEREPANRLEAESRQAEEHEQARQIEEQARQLRETISRNREQIREIQGRQANV